MQENARSAIDIALALLFSGIGIMTGLSLIDSSIRSYRWIKTSRTGVRLRSQESSVSAGRSSQTVPVFKPASTNVEGVVMRGETLSDVGPARPRRSA